MTWNPDVPALANNISADYPDIEENFKELILSAFNRSIFTYNGGSSAATIKLKGAYYCCKDKFCFWSSELTSTQAASGSPTANTWYYLYLDYSAITSGTAITNAELIWSTTAPTWSDSLRGWYNGDDRCVFACMGNAAGDDFDPFTHSGDFVIYDDDVQNYSGAPDTSKTDVTLEIPGFSTKAQITFTFTYVDANSVAYYRRNGQTGTSGHRAGWASAETDLSYNSFPVATDSSGVIEVWCFPTSSNTIVVRTNGWYFPVGM